MHFQPILTLLALAGSTLAAGTVHNVDVGKGGFVFSPTSVKAKVGDHINFHFFAGDHSVAESTFAKPCVPSGPKAIYSGFVNPSGGASEAGTMFSMRVNTTAPIWLYCSQIQHCQGGMAMVVNPPAASTGHTLKAYQKAAGSASGSSPAKVFGGVLEANKGSASTASKAATSKKANSATAAKATTTCVGTYC